MKKWYVVQVFPGYEKIVKADIEKSVQEQELAERFGDILIPSAKMKQFFDVSDSMKDQQLFPGYILVQMEVAPETIRLVSKTPRVSRFLGGKEPVALSQKEIDRIIAQIKGEVVVASEGRKLETGKEIDIKEGPFAGFVGIIEDVDEENEKLTVMVSIFGRMTPVELNFDQIKY